MPVEGRKKWAAEGPISTLCNLSSMFSLYKIYRTLLLPDTCGAFTPAPEPFLLTGLLGPKTLERIAAHLVEN